MPVDEIAAAADIPMRSFFTFRQRKTLIFFWQDALGEALATALCAPFQ
jgi:hypothetical protein